MAQSNQSHLKAVYHKDSAAKELPSFRRYITGHDSNGKATVVREDGGQWTHYNNSKLAFNVLFSTSEMPVDLNNDKDIQLHDKTIAGGMLGLVNPNGTVLRIVDFSPGLSGRMHRTQSLDYGIVLEGEIEMVLDNDERHRLRRGDVAIQRGTIHQWANPTNQWARVAFILQDCKKLEVDGKGLKEDLGGPARYPSSGNDG